MIATHTTNRTSDMRRFDLNVSVEVVPPREAQIECNVWLCNKVVMSFISWEEDKPELLVREDGRVVWRCLVRFVPGQRSGMLGMLGYVDVDAVTQEVLGTDEQVKPFFALAETLIENAPPPHPRRPLPAQFRPPPHLKAPMGTRIP